MSGTDDSTRRRLTVPDAMTLLSRTPPLLDAWLRGLPDDWLRADEGEATWSASQVVGHLILGERTNWMPRLRHILDCGTHPAFPPFTRLSESTTSLTERLEEFARLRATNLADLTSLALDETALDRQGVHPSLGPVTIRQLLAAWVAHDLDHVTQIARVFATQYREEVGPWRVYLRVISGQPSLS